MRIFFNCFPINAFLNKCIQTEQCIEHSKRNLQKKQFRVNIKTEGQHKQQAALSLKYRKTFITIPGACFYCD